jgi:hypothetical protein
MRCGGRTALRSTVCLAAAATGIALIPWHPAAAQPVLDKYLAVDIPGIGVDQGVTVASRQRPDYDAPGIRLGDFTLESELDETVGFDDNVLGQPKGRSSALIESNARVSADYDQRDTAAYATLSVDNNEYPELSEQSFTNWSAAISGSHSFNRDTLSVYFDHINLNETPRDLDVPALKSPLGYQIDTGGISYRAMFGQLFATPSMNFSGYTFTNGAVGGQDYIQTDHDRMVYQPAITFGYEFAPKRDVVLVVRDADASYSNLRPGEASRNFNDISVLAGLDFAEGIFRYRLLAGFEHRGFTSGIYAPINGPVAEGEVIWNPTALATVTGSVSRHVQDSADDITVAYTETATSLKLDYEYQRDILLTINGGYLRDDYAQGGGTQDLISFGAGATWLLNRHMRVGLTYDFDRRNSSNSTAATALIPINGFLFGSSYTENRVLLTLRFGL